MGGLRKGLEKYVSRHVGVDVCHCKSSVYILFICVREGAPRLEYVTVISFLNKVLVLDTAFIHLLAL